jgi:hypothetical protein
MQSIYIGTNINIDLCWFVINQVPLCIKQHQGSIGSMLPQTTMDFLGGVNWRLTNGIIAFGNDAQNDPFYAPVARQVTSPICEWLVYSWSIVFLVNSGQ